MMIIAIILVLSAFAAVYYNDTKKTKELVAESEELRRIKEMDDLNHKFTHAQEICKYLILMIEYRLDENKPKLDLNIKSINKMILEGKLINDVYLTFEVFINPKSVSANMQIIENGVEYNYSENTLDNYKDSHKDAVKFREYIFEHTFKALNS